MDKYHIPQKLNEPFKVILWTVDELAVFLIPFFSLFLFFNSPLCALGLGGTLLYVLKKMKGEEGHYFLLHAMYWYLPPVLFLKATPHSVIREYLG